MNNPIYLQAKSWVGTRFVHQGRLKKVTNSGGGVDCLGLLMGVARELGLRIRNGELLINYDNNEYSKIPDGSYLQKQLDTHLNFVGRSIADVESGDILLFNLDNNPQHLAIAGIENTKLYLVHSHLEAKKVVINGFEEPWIGRLVAVYRL